MSDKPDWVQLAKERAEAATPMWEANVRKELDHDEFVVQVTCLDGSMKDGFRAVGPLVTLPEADDDATFIASARTDILRLIACVEAADALAGAYEAIGHGHHLECRTPYEALPTGECGCHFKAIDAALAAYRTARARGGAK